MDVTLVGTVSRRPRDHPPLTFVSVIEDGTGRQYRLALSPGHLGVRPAHFHALKTLARPGARLRAVGTTDVDQENGRSGESGSGGGGGDRGSAPRPPTLRCADVELLACRDLQPQTLRRLVELSANGTGGSGSGSGSGGGFSRREALCAVQGAFAAAFAPDRGPDSASPTASSGEASQGRGTGGRSEVPRSGGGTSGGGTSGGGGWPTKPRGGGGEAEGHLALALGGAACDLLEQQQRQQQQQQHVHRGGGGGVCDLDQGMALQFDEVCRLHALARAEEARAEEARAEEAQGNAAEAAEAAIAAAAAPAAAANGGDGGEGFAREPMAPPPVRARSPKKRPLVVRGGGGGEEEERKEVGEEVGKAVVEEGVAARAFWRGLVAWARLLEARRHGAGGRRGGRKEGGVVSVGSPGGPGTFDGAGRGSRSQQSSSRPPPAAAAAGGWLLSSEGAEKRPPARRPRHRSSDLEALSLAEGHAAPLWSHRSLDEEGRAGGGGGGGGAEQGERQYRGPRNPALAAAVGAEERPRETGHGKETATAAAEAAARDRGLAVRALALADLRGAFAVVGRAGAVFDSGDCDGSDAHGNNGGNGGGGGLAEAPSGRPTCGDGSRRAHFVEKKLPQVKWFVGTLAPMIAAIARQREQEQRRQEELEERREEYMHPPPPAWGALAPAPRNHRVSSSSRVSSSRVSSSRVSRSSGGNGNGGERRAVHVLDVGGGRGDLAIAIAAASSHEAPCRVTVVDPNVRSLCAGAARARRLGLSNLTFALGALGGGNGNGCNGNSCVEADDATRTRSGKGGDEEEKQGMKAVGEEAQRGRHPPPSLPPASQPPPPLEAAAGVDGGSLRVSPATAAPAAAANAAANAHAGVSAWTGCPPDVDVVVGLHLCGGLADAALAIAEGQGSLALAEGQGSSLTLGPGIRLPLLSPSPPLPLRPSRPRSRIPFLICPCCFHRHPHLGAWGGAEAAQWADRSAGEGTVADRSAAFGRGGEGGRNGRSGGFEAEEAGRERVGGAAAAGAVAAGKAEEAGRRTREESLRAIVNRLAESSDRAVSVRAMRVANSARLNALSPAKPPPPPPPSCPSAAAAAAPRTKRPLSAPAISPPTKGAGGFGLSILAFPSSFSLRNFVLRRAFL